MEGGTEIEQLRAAVAERDARIAELEGQLAKLTELLLELRARLECGLERKKTYT